MSIYCEVDHSKYIEKMEVETNSFVFTEQKKYYEIAADRLKSRNNKTIRLCNAIILTAGFAIPTFSIVSIVLSVIITIMLTFSLKILSNIRYNIEIGKLVHESFGFQSESGLGSNSFFDPWEEDSKETDNESEAETHTIDEEIHNMNPWTGGKVIHEKTTP